VTPIKQRRDFGIAEIDVTQSRDSDALSLLKDIFFFLCGKTDPVIYDPYADEELDNSYWD